jgi:hypothetical protein
VQVAEGQSGLPLTCNSQAEFFDRLTSVEKVSLCLSFLNEVWGCLVFPPFLPFSLDREIVHRITVGNNLVKDAIAMRGGTSRTPSPHDDFSERSPERLRNGAISAVRGLIWFLRHGSISATINLQFPFPAASASADDLLYHIFFPNKHNPAVSCCGSRLQGRQPHER